MRLFSQIMTVVAVPARPLDVPVALVLVERGEPDGERDDGRHCGHGGDGRGRRATAYAAAPSTRSWRSSRASLVTAMSRELLAGGREARSATFSLGRADL